MPPVEAFEGRCQCGRVRYRVTGETVAFFVCHCTECQRQSASAFGMALWLRSYRREILQGQLKQWARTTPTGRQLNGELCPRCGTRVFHQMAGTGEIMSIKPGTLDAPLEVEPVAHLWVSRARRWVPLPAGVLIYPENPPTFDDIFAAWARVRAVAVSSPVVSARLPV